MEKNGFIIRRYLAIEYAIKSFPLDQGTRKIHFATRMCNLRDNERGTINAVHSDSFVDLYRYGFPLDYWRDKTKK